MQLTSEQVLALAPDASSAAAGKKLGAAKSWRNLGRSGRALWGECQGSALYQVRVDLSDLSAKCSCPSRKFPCKHALGLMLVAAGEPQALAEAAEPEWVGEWLGRRAASATKKESREERSAAEPDPQAREERAAKRLERMTKGIEGLERWMEDLVRNGLAGLESERPAFWETQAARLVDAQAPGFAGRVRRLAGLPGSRPDWPAVLLAELGRLALATQAFRRLEQLDGPLQEEVRRLTGLTLKEEEVIAQGESVTDRWAVLGQTVEDDEKVRAQRTWLLGETTGRAALVLQFAAGDGPFPSLFVPGTRFEADLAFWPGSWPLRALVRERRGTAEPLQSLPAVPGTDSIASFLDATAETLARQPWLDRLPCVLCEVVPATDGGKTWWLQDRDHRRLPLGPGHHWQLLAVSGGHPVDLAGEWDGEAVLPFGAIAQRCYQLVRSLR